MEILQITERVSMNMLNSSIQGYMKKGINQKDMRKILIISYVTYQ